MTDTIQKLKRDRFATFAEGSPAIGAMSHDLCLDIYDNAPVREKVAFERAVGITRDHWNDDDEAVTLFDEKDWVRDPGPRSNDRWRNVKTGTRKYGKENPGKGKGVAKNAAATASKFLDDIGHATADARDAKETASQKARITKTFADTPPAYKPVADALAKDIDRAPERAKALAAVPPMDPAKAEKKFDDVSEAMDSWLNQQYENGGVGGDNGKSDDFGSAIGDIAALNYDGLVAKYGHVGAGSVALAALTGGCTLGTAAAAIMGSTYLSFAFMSGIDPLGGVNAVKAAAGFGAVITSLPVVALVHTIRGMKRLVFGKGGDASKTSTHAEGGGVTSTPIMHPPMTRDEIARAAIAWLDESAINCFEIVKKRGLLK